MGEWSPECTGCTWGEGEAARAGAWFTGRNETEARVWETRCQVVTADPGREFTFVVVIDDEARTRWSYTFAAVPDGTELTESWQVLPAWPRRWADHSDDEVRALLAGRTKTNVAGIPATLAAIKRVAEASA